jgi:KUP system potassium uptake protein
LAALGTLFLIVEVSFFTSNLSKISHGAYFSLGVGLAVAFVMITWRRGRLILTRNRTEEEGSLTDFLSGLRTHDPPLRRIAGTAIFLNPGKQTTPLALRAEVKHSHIFPEKVVIVSVDSVSISQVEAADRFKVEWLGEGMFKVAYVAIRLGYQEKADVPALLALARKRGLLERNLDLEHASYIISRMHIVPTDAPGMHRWRKALFIFMARNATSPITHFGLPGDRTVMMGSQVGV